MKRSVIVVVALLLLFPAVSMATDKPSFESGQEEVIANLAAPGFEATVNLEIPAGYYVTNATMKVTGMAAEGNASAYPEGVSVKLNDSVIWAFQQTGFGPMGRQNRFSDGQKQVNSSFSSAGGVKSQYIRLPKEATVMSATMELHGFPPTPGRELVNFTGNAANDALGRSVSDAGDVNGDGYDDVIVGAYNNGPGLAYIYSGGPDFDNVADVTLSGSGSDSFSSRVSSAGDVNNDGFDDVLVYASRGHYVCIFYGGQDMDTTADVTISIPQAELFASISGLGDVNSDGYDDVIIGIPGDGPGKAYIYFGGANMDNGSDLILSGEITKDYFGYSVSGAGDVNDDGYADVIVGAPNYPGNEYDGRAYVYLGGSNMDNTSDVIFPFHITDDSFGTSVSDAGDVNDDGFDDVIVGTYDAGDDLTGEVYIYFGGPNMDNISDIQFSGLNYSAFGFDVSSAGDLNGDGYSDVIIGAYSDDTVGNAYGGVYAYFGGKPMDNVSDMKFYGESENDWYSYRSLSGAGDLNGDGYDEIIVGAMGIDDGGEDVGRAYVYTCFVPDLTGILDPGVSIGSKNIWKEAGYFNRTVVLADLAGELNAYLGSASISGKDAYGNSYVDVPVNINASGGGKLSLANLVVSYSYEAAVPDFTTMLGEYLAIHQNDTDGNSVIKVPIKIRSVSAGRIKLFGLEVDASPDLPPALVKNIEDAELPENTWNYTLIDLYPYFRDDRDSDTMLDFTLVSATNSSFVTVNIRNNRHVAANAFTGDENDNWTGTVEVVVACSDHWGHTTESNIFRIVVKNVNDGPIITSDPPTVAEAGVPYFYNVTAIDGDNDPLHFNLTQAPVDMAINADTGQIIWLPHAKGNFSVFITVSDGILSAEQRFTMIVPNKAPRITSSPLLNATTGVQYVYTVTAEDDNLDPLTYSLQSSIEGMTIDSAKGTLLWTPQNVGNVDVSVQVSDGKAKATQDFAIKVAQANRAPKFVSKPVTTAMVDVAYSYAAKATDMDNDVLEYSLETAPEGMTVDGVTGKVDWTPSAAENFTVKIKVADKKGGEAVQEFVINVKDRVKATVNILRPIANEKVKGKSTVSGTAVKGTLEVASVQVRVDGGSWVDAAGNYSWSYDLDTTKLKNGKHSLEVRAFDGKDYSEIAKVEFSVDNQKVQGKGFIPGFEVGLVLMAMILAFSVGLGRRRMNRRGLE